MSRTLFKRLAGALTLFLAAAGVAVPAASAAAPGVLGEWSFDEGAGQITADGGPFALPGQLGASTAPGDDDPSWVPGLSGSALHFDGLEGVRLPDSDRLNAPTITAEVVLRSPRSPGAWRYIVSRGGRECLAGAYGLYTGAAAGIAFYVFDGSGYVVSPVVSPEDIWDGAWHHVAGTFDGSAVRLYLDGRPVGSPIATGLQIDYSTTTTRTYFGRYAGDCELGFAGDLDQVRLWSQALDQNAVVAAAAGAGVTAGTAPLAPAAPGTVLAGQPGSQVAARGTRLPSCRLRLARPRAGLARATLRVRVTRSGKPWHKVRVIAQRSGRRGVLGSARTNRAGRALLRVRVQRSTRLRVSAKGHRICTPAYVRVKPRG
jgi:Concanavalin A-like lectin/glucanases superfamily